MMRVSQLLGRASALAIIASLFGAGGLPALAAETFAVTKTMVGDPKAVFATVESSNVVPARARIGGTVARLSVKEGDHVKRDQVIATIGDEKLVLQMKSLDAQIAALQAQHAQAQTDFDRIEGLVQRGTTPRTQLDQARTSLTVAQDTLNARIAERSVIQQQHKEGDVLAPTDGRVLKKPITVGSVVMPGEPVVSIAEQDFVLRLRVPERHAHYLKVDDTVRVDSIAPGDTTPRFGTVRLIYPQIEEGRVTADAVVKDLGDYFVGERLRVWIADGQRPAFIIPASYITTRFGVDYVRVSQGERTVDVPVQRGRMAPRPDMLDAVEILSGLNAGDKLVRP
jgi:RND family efflux transporter MFP subunit